MSGTKVADTTSGFRAFSRDAAMQLHVFNEYTYTLESIIQAGLKGMAVTSVEIGVNPDLSPSRLVESIPSYVRRQHVTIIRIFVVTGFVTDLVASNRKLLERLDWKPQRLRHE